MDHFKRFKRQVALRTLICLLLPGAVGLASFIVLSEFAAYELVLSLSLAAGAYLLAVAGCYLYLSPSLTDPIKNIWQAVWHISPGKESVPAPKLDTVRAGRELVSSLVLQIYNLVQQQ